MPGSPSLPSSNNPPRFFGLDLGSLGRDLLTAWRGMLDWPVLAWLWPTSAVRLWLPSGESALSLSLNTPAVHDPKRTQSARFEAVVLPEQLLLRRGLDLPALQPAELHAALALQLQTLSPFAPHDAIWTHDTTPADGGLLRAQVVLTSRKLIDEHVRATHPQLQMQSPSQAPEVWTTRSEGPGFMPLPGFGESRRLRQGTAWRWVSAALAVLALTMVAAMAVTPTVKLYLRSLQADLAMTALLKKAAPVLQQREALTHTTEQLANLASAAGMPVAPLQALNLITESLPDDTSLQSIRIDGANVTLTGQTSNAATLMKQLGGTSGLRDVKAPIAATKPLGAPRETFVIEFTLDSAKPRATP